MRNFILKILLFMTPFGLLALLFVVFDPFKIVWSYEAFGSHQPVSINVDYISTETYLRNRSERAYDSFIFGSSRTLAFRTDSWRSYLGEAAPLHYNANLESLFGIWAKVRMIDRLGDRIANALLIVDPDLLSRVDDSLGHLYVKHPTLSGGSWAAFFRISLSAFLSDIFFVKYIDYRLFGTYRSYMEGVINIDTVRIDPITNDLTLVGWERELREDPDGYYEKHRSAFGPRGGEGPAVLQLRQRSMVEEIHRIFQAHGTKIRIVVSPNYDQVPLHPLDLEVLRQLFGSGNVRDYSGVNEITSDVRNYYERVHFRPHVGESILSDIYGTESE